MFVNSIYYAALLAASANAHGVILAAQGEAGSVASVGFQVDPNIPRNCTDIQPCQQDSTIIRDSEITANIVNTCGRTQLTGNIDIGENAENELAAKRVTSVKAGTTLTVTMHQVNSDGAGPYVCDLDLTSNAGAFTQNLTVTNNIPGSNGLSQTKFTAFNLTVKMPDNYACNGGSSGNLCTVRCRNNAVAGPFGGCFAVQQTDVTPSVNTPSSVKTAAKLAAIAAQVAVDQSQLPAALKTIADSGIPENMANKDNAMKLAGNVVATANYPTESPVRDLTPLTPAPAAAAPPKPAAASPKKGN